MRKIKKPWGWEKILHQDRIWTVKILHINKGKRLSEQYHTQKYEVMFLPNRQIIPIPAKMIHRPYAPQECDIEVIEVSYSGFEEDIVRLNDDFGRCNSEMINKNQKIFK